MSKSSSPPLPTVDDMPPALDEAALMAERVLYTPFTVLFGYHIARTRACKTVAWIANYWEDRAYDWKIIVLAGSYSRLALRNFGEIANQIKFTPVNHGRSFARGRHGIVRATFADIGAIVGTMGDRVLWFVDEGVPDVIWDYIVQEVSILSDSHPDVERLIAINPPMERYHLFGEEVSR